MCACGQPFTKHSGTFQTLVGYSRETGHDHDDNCQYRIYVCAAGHQTKLYRQNHCSQCDWVGKLTCFCHEGLKIAEWPAAEPMTRAEVLAIIP